MVGAEVQRGLEEHQGIAGQDALGDAVAKTLFNRRDEVLGHAAAHGLVHEDQILGLGLGLEADVDVAELAVAAGLLLVPSVDFDLLLDGLAVGDLGRAQLGLHLELAQELGAQDAQVDIAHAGDNHFLGLGVVAEAEGEILFIELVEAGGDLVLLPLDLGVDGHGVAGLVVGHALEGGDLPGQTQRVAGLHRAELGGNAQIAAADLGRLGEGLALGEEDIGELFSGAGAGVDQAHALGDVAGDDLEVGVLAELVGGGLEDEDRGASLGVEHQLAALGSGHGQTLQGVGAELHNVFHHALAAVAHHGAAAEDGGDGALAHAVLDALDELFLGEGLLHEEFLHEFLAGLGHLLGELCQVLLAALLGLGGEGGRVALGVAGGAAQKIDQADALVALHHGEDQGDDGVAEGGAHIVDHLIIVGVILVHLGDVEHGGHVGVLEGLPGLLGAHGDAALGREDDEAGVSHAEGLDDLAGKVEEAGVVQEVNLAAFKIHRNDRSGNGVFPLDFLGIKVRNGVAVGDGAQAVGTVG